MSVKQGSFGQRDFHRCGYEDGLRDGMEFLVERMNDQNALPFRARLGLVQDRYSYLEFLSDDTPLLPLVGAKEENLTDQAGSDSFRDR